MNYSATKSLRPKPLTPSGVDRYIIDMRKFPIRWGIRRDYGMSKDRHHTRERWAEVDALVVEVISAMGGSVTWEELRDTLRLQQTRGTLTRSVERLIGGGRLFTSIRRDGWNFHPVFHLPEQAPESVRRVSEAAAVFLKSGSNTAARHLREAIDALPYDAAELESDAA